MPGGGEMLIQGASAEIWASIIKSFLYLANLNFNVTLTPITFLYSFASGAIRLQSASERGVQDAAASRPVPDPRCLCGAGEEGGCWDPWSRP